MKKNETESTEKGQTDDHDDSNDDGSEVITVAIIMAIIASVIRTESKGEGDRGNHEDSMVNNRNQ